MKQSRIRKSASLVIFKTLPHQQIVFNPKEFQVGQSRISRLPQRPLSRRNSLATLPKTQKPTPLKQLKSPKQLKQLKQPKQLQLVLLQKINEKLTLENKQLKNQLELYKKISRSNSSKGKSSYISEEPSKAELNLKNIVIQKINRTKCSSRLTQDNQTGLYSSKQVSYTNQIESIKQMNDNFIKRAIKPTLQQYQEQLKKFFNQFEETFIKMKHLFESISKQQQLSNPTSYSQCQSLLQSINEICLMKVQKQKVAKNPILGKSRPKVQRQQTREKVCEKEEILELLPLGQIVERLQRYMAKVLTSPSIMAQLKTNLIARKFTKKLSEA